MDINAPVTPSIDSAVSLAAELDAPGLVFLMVLVQWRRRPSDLRVNTTIAERWEGAFADWSIEGRTVRLVASESDVSIHLADGSAQFEIQTGGGLRLAMSRLPDLLETLVKGKREELRVLIEAQFLHNSPPEFAALVGQLSKASLNSNFLSRIGANMLDFAYLADVTIAGKWMQLNFGPVKSHEIPSRIRATNLDVIPETAIYLNVTSRLRLKEPSADKIQERLTSIVRVGNDVTRELKA